MNDIAGLRARVSPQESVARVVPDWVAALISANIVSGTYICLEGYELALRFHCALVFASLQRCTCSNVCCRSTANSAVSPVISVRTISINIQMSIAISTNGLLKTLDLRQMDFALEITF